MLDTSLITFYKASSNEFLKKTCFEWGRCFQRNETPNESWIASLSQISLHHPSAFDSSFDSDCKV